MRVVCSSFITDVFQDLFLFCRGLVRIRVFVSALNLSNNMYRWGASFVRILELSFVRILELSFVRIFRVFTC